MTLNIETDKVMKVTSRLHAAALQFLGQDRKVIACADEVFLLMTLQDTPYQLLHELLIFLTKLNGMSFEPQWSAPIFMPYNAHCRALKLLV